MITFDPAKIDWTLTLGFFLMIAAIYLLFKAQYSPKNKNKFDAAEMFQDERDKTSMAKFFYMIGGLTSTWIVVSYAVKDKLGWEMFAAYLGALVAGKALTEFAAKKDP